METVNIFSIAFAILGVRNGGQGGNIEKKGDEKIWKEK